MIIVPIITCVIWNKVNKKKFVNIIELDKLNFIIIYSKYWIIKKYILNIIVK